jgi:hypothetical protein
VKLWSPFLSSLPPHHWHHLSEGVVLTGFDAWPQINKSEDDMAKRQCRICGYTGINTDFVDNECPDCFADMETGVVDVTFTPPLYPCPAWF